MTGAVARTIERLRVLSARRTFITAEVTSRAGPAVMMTPMMAITQTSTTELPEPGRGSNNSISFELVAKFSMWIAIHQYHQ